jgi:hypothetical protein
MIDKSLLYDIISITLIIIGVLFMILGVIL